ncbi:hypothetical protein TSAR_007605 [Trichomalopsis sarcophagae]|uniref:Uncharacterized protein n=1 Tax=Trichomalopsis sarcophagae TaxID=543379 RepID=A0A232EH67_9HYME|nr:hypothetical protein TSAR_007605 [Trichomalopsis sarcophagae]
MLGENEKAYGRRSETGWTLCIMLY